MRWQPTVEQQAACRKVGVGLQERSKDGGPFRADDRYWMAWVPGTDGRLGQAVDNWQDVVRLARSHGTLLPDDI